MRKMNLVCGLLAIALGQIVWADQPAKSDCDIDAGSNQCMLDQVNAEFVKADAARYAAYEQLFGYVQTNPDVNEITTSGAGSFASVISRAEQSWKNFRDDQCSLESFLNGGGGGAGGFGVEYPNQQCRIKSTNERTKQLGTELANLKSYLEGYRKKGSHRHHRLPALGSATH